jgi:hypothetical protein
VVNIDRAVRSRRGGLRLDPPRAPHGRLGWRRPVARVLTWLLYNEYFVPYRGGGTSMWPIAQLVAGTVAAAVGMLATAVTRAARVKLQASARL